MIKIFNLTKEIMNDYKNGKNIFLLEKDLKVLYSALITQDKENDVKQEFIIYSLFLLIIVFVILLALPKRFTFKSVGINLIIIISVLITLYSIYLRFSSKLLNKTKTKIGSLAEQFGLDLSDGTNQDTVNERNSGYDKRYDGTAKFRYRPPYRPPDKRGEVIDVEYEVKDFDDNKNE